MQRLAPRGIKFRYRMPLSQSAGLNDPSNSRGRDCSDSQLVGVFSRTVSRYRFNIFKELSPVRGDSPLRESPNLILLAQNNGWFIKLDDSGLEAAVRPSPILETDISLLYFSKSREFECVNDRNAD